MDSVDTQATGGDGSVDLYDRYLEMQTDLRKLQAQIKTLRSNELKVARLGLAKHVNQPGSLLSDEPDYVHSLKIMLLRIMIFTAAVDQLKKLPGSILSQASDFLALTTYESVAAKSSLRDLRNKLLIVLDIFEKKSPAQNVFPVELGRNLNRLAKEIGLNEVEKTILGFCILLHTEGILYGFVRLIGDDLCATAASGVLSTILGIDKREVELALDDKSKLMASGVLSLDLYTRNDLRSCVEFITPTFPVRILREQGDIRALIKSYVVVSAKSQLRASDYQHLGNRLDHVKIYLEEALAQRRKGANILIYGRPGTGKTQFARVIASELGCELVEVSATNLAGDPVTPMRRTQGYRMAQSFFKQGKTLVLFDESEEVLVSIGALETSQGEATRVQKSWVNRALEENEIPAIWVANSIEAFDPAYLRRFDLCFEMPIPTLSQRQRILETAVDGAINRDLIAEIAKHPKISPALVVQAAGVVKSIVRNQSQCEVNAIALQQINDKLIAQGDSPLPLVGLGQADRPYFRPEVVNCGQDLDALCEGIKRAGRARLCLYGAPGSGKTAFGKWLAQSMDRPHLVFAGSQLLSPYIGETEQKIAEAFATAKREMAVLQLDEVDGLLHDRVGAKQSWEITMVNEMLTQMENYDGVFIASTNRFDQLDEASLRRFDLSIKFGFLTQEKASVMFADACKGLGFATEDIGSDVRAKIGGIANLTPGDFAQAMRRNLFAKFQTPLELARNLVKACAQKKSGANQPIGFVK